MTDIVEELREWSRIADWDNYSEMAAVGCEAAGQIERLRDCTEDLLRWCEALAIVGAPTPEAWAFLDKISQNARAVLGEKNEP